jgi:hypothetical protein
MQRSDKMAKKIEQVLTELDKKSNTTPVVQTGTVKKKDQVFSDLYHKDPTPATPAPQVSNTSVSTYQPTPQVSQSTPIVSSPSGNTSNTTTRKNETPEFGNETVSSPETPSAGQQENYNQDIQNYINELAEAKKRAQLAALDNAYNTALASLAERESGLGQQYYDAKNRAAAQSDIGALNFAQRAASLGIKGNAGNMPEIYRNAALQGNIGVLETQEQADRSAIARDRTNLANRLAADKASAEAGIDAASLQSYIDQMNLDRAFNYQMGRDTVADTRWNKQFEADERQRAIENEYRNRSLDENIRQFNARYGLDLRQLNLQEANAAIENAYRQRQLSLDEARQALDEAKFIYNQSVDQQQQSNYNQGVFRQYLEDVRNMLNEVSDYDENGYPITRYSNDQIIQYVRNLPITWEEKAQILNALGIE